MKVSADIELFKTLPSQAVTLQIIQGTQRTWFQRSHLGHIQSGCLRQVAFDSSLLLKMTIHNNFTNNYMKHIYMYIHVYPYLSNNNAMNNENNVYQIQATVIKYFRPFPF
jgi:hypothetical protein